MSFEHTEVTIPKYLKSIQDTQNALKRYAYDTTTVRFSGYTFEKRHRPAVQSPAPP